jgi:hypothetical protein
MFQIISFYLEVSIVAIPLPDYPSLDQNDESHLYYPLCKQRPLNTFDIALNNNSVDYIMATGDFNENQLNSSNSKIKSLLAQFSLNQLIDHILR